MYASVDSTDHLHRTAGQFRVEDISAAVIKDISDISPTVKKLSVEVQNKTFAFKAGQWVDFMVPGIDTVGGFSMCSSPHKLKSQGLIDLAVKYSTHPPALWVHTKCKPGCKVDLRIGGDFYFDPFKYTDTKDLLLIAGGVGINPLMSIMNHIGDMTPDQGTLPQVVHLIHSARTQEELIFKDELQALCQKNSCMNCHFHVTKETYTSSKTLCDMPVSYGRISLSSIEQLLTVNFPDIKKLVCFICGPGSMAESLEQTLLKLKLEKEQIIYEKWW